MSGVRLSAKLDRTDKSTPWGFRLHGGKDFSSPLSIQRVTPGSMAAKCGLQVGDHIISIGETPTDGLYHKEAQQRIVASGNSLDLKLERGGSKAAPVESSPAFNPQPSYQPTPAAAPYSQQPTGQTYNVKPKPFVPGGSASGPSSTVPVAMNNQYNTPINMYSVDNVMTSLTTQTGGMNIGSGNSVTTMAPSQHAASPPPPLPESQPPLFTTQTAQPTQQLHAPLHDLHLHDTDQVSPTLQVGTNMSSPSVTKTPQLYSPAGYSRISAPSNTTATKITPRSGSPPRQSAINEDVNDESGVPRFRGYTNPSLQSRTFKILQEKIDAGEEISPGLGAASTKTTPVRPVGGAGPEEQDSKYVKAIMNKQYNTPASLYSTNNISDTYNTQATNIMDKLQRDDEPTTSSDSGKKVYVASETFRMVQEMDTGSDRESATQKRGPVPAPFNPLSSYQKTDKREQRSPTYRSTQDTTSERLSPAYSPTYKPTERTTVKEPAYSPTYKPSMDVNANNRSPTYKSELQTKSYEAPMQSSMYKPPSSDSYKSSSKVPVETKETMVQNRATITVSPRVKQDSVAAVKDLPAFRKQSPRPFQKPHDEPSKPAAPSYSAAPSGGSWNPQIPTGPRQMKVGRLGEARSMPASGQGRIPICSGCGVSIRGPFVLALDKSWCPDHFKCANPQCGRPLIDVGFVEEGGQLYCESDYEQFLAPRCGKCGGAIVGDRIEATGTSYHLDCFLCTHCRQPIGGTSFHIEGGEFYCQKDWAALFQTKCYGCQFPIEPGDKWVEALGQNWHSECFNCSTCQVNLEGQPFYAKAGKPFCKKHAMGAPRY